VVKLVTLSDRRHTANVSHRVTSLLLRRIEVAGLINDN
jgi:hypothetical protein